MYRAGILLGMDFRRISILLIVAVALTAQAQNVTPELGKMFSYNSAAPLDLQKRVFDHQPSATIYDIDFASPKDGRVTGFLVLPTSSGLHPGIIFGHWGQGDRLEFLPEALIYARAGIAAIMIDYPWVRP
jgi:hypothetical protein